MPHLCDTKYVNSPTYGVFVSYSIGIVQHINSANLYTKSAMLYNIIALLLQVTGTTHNKRGDPSVRLVHTTNPQQIEVMELALI